MRIIFKHLELNNFMSYEHAEFDLDKHEGLTLVTGINKDIPGAKNGSGKSNLFSSLTYALYGELPHKLRVDNISNRFVDDKSMSVSLTFETGDNKYKVISGVRGKGSYCELYQMNDDGELESISKSSIKETREFIRREILGFGMDVFMRTILLNSDPTYNFHNMKGEDRKKFIDSMFDLKEYGDMFEVLKKNRIELKNSINIVKNTILTLMKNNDDYSRSVSEFDANKETMIAKYSIELENLKNDYEEEKKKTVSCDNEMIDKCTKGIEVCNNNISKLKLKKQKIDFENRNIATRISNNNSRISEYNRMIEKHSTVIGKVCGDCKPILEKHYNIDSYRNEITKLENENSGLKNSIDNASSTSISSKIVEFETKRTKIQEKKISLSSEYVKKQRLLSDLSSRISDTKAKYDNAVFSVNPYTSLIEENNRRMQKEQETENVLKHDYNLVDFACSIVDKDALKRFIIDNLLDIFNGSVRKYIMRLGTNYGCRFDPDMNCYFTTSNKESNPEYSNFSSGEQMRISIATCFAIRDFISTRSNIDTNILILDEYMDSNIDSMAIENIQDILKEFVNINHQNIYIISHRSEVNSENYNTIVEIVKENNRSMITFKK